MAVDYEIYAEKHPYFQTATYPPLYESLVRDRSGTFLEVGCGDGNQLQHFLQTGSLSAFDRILASDISRTRISRIDSNIPGVKAFVADAVALPVESESIDVLFSNQVIEHVDDDVAMAREIFRVLKPGGTSLVGSVVKGKGAWYFYRCRGAWRLDPTHVREYTTAAAYRNVFEEVGFEVRSTESEDVVFPLRDLMLRLTFRMAIGPFRRAVDSASFRDLSMRIPSLGIPIPRYEFVYALLEKPKHSGGGG